jgi:hypothetical protein
LESFHGQPSRHEPPVRASRRVRAVPVTSRAAALSMKLNIINLLQCYSQVSPRHGPCPGSACRSDQGWQVARARGRYPRKELTRTCGAGMLKRMASTLWIGTRKGAFALRPDVRRRGWKLSGPQILGHIIHHGTSTEASDPAGMSHLRNVRARQPSRRCARGEAAGMFPSSVLPVTADR